ncbi:MAG: hypothetical protein RLZZ141_1844 [Pseudomonadota bacterium]|jgi:UrcA family protein
MKIARLVLSIGDIFWLSSLLVISLFGAAHAESSPRMIRINDLNLSQPQDAAKFEQRLKGVVRDFCDAERGLREHRICQDLVRREVLDQLSQTQREQLRIAESGTRLSATNP